MTLHLCGISSELSADTSTLRQQCDNRPWTEKMGHRSKTGTKTKKAETTWNLVLVETKTKKAGTTWNLVLVETCRCCHKNFSRAGFFAVRLSWLCRAVGGAAWAADADRGSVNPSGAFLGFFSYCLFYHFDHSCRLERVYIAGAEWWYLKQLRADRD